MSQPFQKTKPSFLEAGLPCASLSAECQRDNNARQRPPQNRLHIWWARRPPTICRAAILASLLPYDLELDEAVLPPVVNEPSVEDLEDLPPKLQPHQAFFERLLTDVRPTQLTPAHEDFLRAMGITGDSARAWRRLALAEGANNGRDITLGSTWGYRHQRAFAVSPSSALLAALHSSGCELLQTIAGHEIVLLDPMAGGGSIPLEGIRYGFKVYANELNPVGALILKATLEYPSRFGRTLAPKIEGYAQQVHENVRQRLVQFFPYQHADDWWKEEEANAIRTFKAKSIVSRQPAWNHNPIKNTYLRGVHNSLGERGHDRRDVT